MYLDRTFAQRIGSAKVTERLTQMATEWAHIVSSGRADTWRLNWIPTLQERRQERFVWATWRLLVVHTWPINLSINLLVIHLFIYTWNRPISNESSWVNAFCYLSIESCSIRVFRPSPSHESLISRSTNQSISQLINHPFIHFIQSINLSVIIQRVLLSVN